MRELMKRLDKLETAQAYRVRPPLRIVRQFIGVNPNGGGPLFDPSWAEGRWPQRSRGYPGEGERIERAPGESGEAFEARAREHFHDCGYYIG